MLLLSQWATHLMSGHTAKIVTVKGSDRDQPRGPSSQDSPSLAEEVFPRGPLCHSLSMEAPRVTLPSVPFSSDVVLSSGRHPVSVRWLSQRWERELREIQTLCPRHL